MKRGSTLFLKLTIFLIAFVALSWMIIFPQTEGRAKDLDLIRIYKDPFIIYIYIAFIPFFVALFQALKLLGYVDKNKIFSQDAVRAIRNIKYCVLTFIGFIVLALIFIFINSRITRDDGAGAIALGLVIVFTSSVIATGAAVFQKILQNAVDIKSENDLTV